MMVSEKSQSTFNLSLLTRFSKVITIGHAHYMTCLFLVDQHSMVDLAGNT